MANSNLVFWNRLEGSPQSQDFERSLRAEIRDPLWLLSRQWQLGEFVAEDAGSAVLAGVSYRQVRARHVSLNGRPDQPLPDEVMLESVVESVQTSFDLSLRMELGRHWLRMLRQALPEPQETIEAFQNNHLIRFKLPQRSSPSERYDHAAILSDPAFLQTLSAAVKGKMIDGGVFYALLKVHGFTASAFLPEKNGSIDAVGEEFLSWFERVYGQGAEKKGAWNSRHLEYSFALDLDREAAPRRLQADEYPGEDLDWYHFDYAPGTDSGEVPPAAATKEQLVFPSEVAYPGMPATRWWEMEDSLIDFANIRASSTDMAKLLYSEFGMLFGNDWLVMPLNLSVGSQSNIEAIVLTDVFGLRSRVARSLQSQADENWGLFQLHDRSNPTPAQADPYLFLPPVAIDIQEGPPLERVEFIRDEMANMVWAVETTVPNGLGGWSDGLDQSRREETFLQHLAGDPLLADLLDNEAVSSYQIATQVPPHWIPFIPVKSPALPTEGRELLLQRAAMPRLLAGFAPRRIRPKTTLVGHSPEGGTRYVFEEEIPRSGITLQLRWRRARGYDGRIYVWLGYQKQVGRGEGASKLQFDRMV